MIIRVKARDRYTLVDNRAVEDPRLSFRALGLLTYLLSKPDDWRANYRHLSTTHTDGETSVRAGMKELTACGYIERERGHDETGRIEWELVVHEVSLHHAGVSHAWLSHAGETAPVVTTEEATTEEQEPESPDGDVGALLTNLEESIVDARVEALCTHLADRIAQHRGGDRPPITKAWRKAMRLLLERGPLHVDKPEPLTPERVRVSIDAVFDHLATPDGRGFCWADQIRSAGALRDHFVQLKQAYRRATQGSVGRGAQAVERVVARAAADVAPSLEPGGGSLGLLAIEPKETA